MEKNEEKRGREKKKISQFKGNTAEYAGYV